MHKKTIIAIIAGITAVLSYLLYSWGIAQSLRMVYQIVQVSCYAYLVYYWFWRKSHIRRSSPSLLRFLKFYSVLLRIVGWIFIFAGGFMILYAFSRISDKSLPGDKSGDWEGAGMSLLNIVLGMMAIIISKKLKNTTSRPNSDTGDANGK
jgi:hypothetical protein